MQTGDTALPRRDHPTPRGAPPREADLVEALQTDDMRTLLTVLQKPGAARRMDPSVLLLAARHGSDACVECLISYGMDALAADDRRRTALHEAAAAGRAATVETLLGLRGVASNELVQSKDREGETALHLAAAGKRD